MIDTAQIHLMMHKVQEFLGQWLECHLKEICPDDWWARCVMDVLVPEQRENVLNDGATSPSGLDLAMQLSVFRGNWQSFRRKYHLNPQLYDDAIAVKRIRNKYSHWKSTDSYDDRLDHDMETVRLFLKGLGAPDMQIAGDKQTKDNATDKTKEETMTFDSIIEDARNTLPKEVRRAPWIGLGHGVEPLDTEQKLNQYLAAYGKMHAEKIRIALDSLDDPTALLSAPVSVVDWGCGQGLATCCFFDWLQDNEIDVARIGRIHLIEPSTLALQRAKDNIIKYEKMHNCQFDIHTVNRFLNDIQPSDCDIRGINATLHLFSNVLDIETINLDALAQFIRHTFVGRQIFCCVGPINNGASRIMEFAGKFGIAPEQIEANCQGKLAHSRGTISMLTFVIDAGRSSIRKVMIEPTAPHDVRNNITLQRLLNRHEPRQDVLDRILQFYLMSTELEQLKEPKVDNEVPFTMTETSGGVRVSFDVNCSGNTRFAENCRDFAERCARNADRQQTKWPKDIHFALDVAWDANTHPLLYSIKPLSELSDFDYEHDTLTINFCDFSVNLALAESLELTDEQIAEIEHALHSNGISLDILVHQLHEIIDPAAELNTTQIRISLCDKNAALSQTYAELKKMDAEAIRTNPLLEAFLENAELQNSLESFSPKELISAVPMDDYQRRSIAHVLSHRVSVVVGPPGCGKTQLLLNLLVNALARGKKVLVASKNNKAVDNVAERFGKFDENGCFLRFGSKNHLRDVTSPQLNALLNLAQSNDYDDGAYTDAMAKISEAAECIMRESHLEHELLTCQENVSSAKAEIDRLNVDLKVARKDEENELARFRENAKEGIVHDLSRHREQCAKVESRIASIDAELREAHQEEAQIVPEFMGKAKEKINDELERLPNSLATLKCEIANNDKEIASICENRDKELKNFVEAHTAMSAVDEVRLDEIRSIASRLGRLRTEIEYATGGFGGFFVRIFRRKKIAKRAIDVISEFPDSICEYLRGIDASGISDFRSCSAIVAFCKTMQQGMDKIVEYRRRIANIQDEAQSRIDMATKSKCEAQRKMIVLEDYEIRLNDCLESAQSLEEYMRSEFGAQFVARQRQIQEQIQTAQVNMGSLRETLEKERQASDHAAKLLANEQDFSKYFQEKCKSQIANLRRNTEELIADKGSQIRRMVQIRDEGTTRINEIEGSLQKTRELMATVASTTFGQKFIALALNHYLHSTNSARAISAYAFYLPDNIPWKNTEVQDFITSTKRFLDACPLVAVTSLSVKNAFPRTEGLFDLLVIDEASQCDVASALPLILRSKQIAIIGDPMQLRHISKIDSEEELAIKRHLGLLNAIHLKYADASLWDYTRNWLPWCGNDPPCVLENHYRCHPDIIGYSNNMFYRTLAFGGLNVCTPKFDGDGQGVVWVDVHGQQASDTVNRNEAEAQKALEIARQCAQKYPDATIGIVTPFTAQAERINALITAELSARTIADTVHKFQGDEKDIMIYSLVVTDNSPNGKIRWIDYKVPNLVNVAVTRAKRLLVIVGNRNYIKTHSRTSLPLGFLENYVRTIEERRKARAGNR